MRITASALDIRARLFDLLLVHQDPSGKNERLRALSRRRQPAFQQQFVEPRSHAARLARARRKIRRAMNSDSVVIPHLAQGRVLDVSNCEELSELRIALFHKLMHTCVENCCRNSSEPQPATFFYDRMTNPPERENGDQEREPDSDANERKWRQNRCKRDRCSRNQRQRSRCRRIRKFCAGCTLPC